VAFHGPALEQKGELTERNGRSIRKQPEPRQLWAADEKHGGNRDQREAERAEQHRRQAIQAVFDHDEIQTPRNDDEQCQAQVFKRHGVPWKVTAARCWAKWARRIVQEHTDVFNRTGVAGGPRAFLGGPRRYSAALSTCCHPSTINRRLSATPSKTGN
jgi:hypothetical protein